MTLYTATVTLILVMDPLGNVPVFLSILNPIDPKRRARIILRETFIAFLILCSFLFVGQGILNSFSITQPALGIAGGIILFLIAIKMIFPPEHEGPNKMRERFTGEPFIVPLAIPLIAGPSAMATILLFTSQSPDKTSVYLVALMLASGVCTLTLLFSNQLRKLLREKGLIALERLMGMLLTTLAVQMFLNGLGEYLNKS